MIIELGYATSRLVADAATIAFIRETSATPIKTFNKWAKTWNTHLEYTMDKAGSFPTGLWRNVKHWLQEAGHTVELVETRVRPGVVPSLEHVSFIGLTPLDFQVDACVRLMKYKNALMKATTAAGKSVCIFTCSQMVHDIKWLVITDSKTVARQLANEYEKLTGCKAGRALPDMKWTDGDIVFATYSQFASKLDKLAKTGKDDVGIRKLLASFQGVLIDEVQSAPAVTHFNVLMHLTNAYYRLGFSGSPFGRSDGKDEFVIGASGPQVVEVTAPEMIEIGRVSKPTARFVAFYHEPIPPRGPADPVEWETDYKKTIVFNRARNELICDIVDTAAKPLFIFADRLIHGKLLEKLIAARGWEVKTITGETSDQTVEDRLNQMRSGRLDVIVTNKVLNKGVSVTNLAAVVIAGANRAEEASVQRLGRPMRTEEGKDTCEYWDVADVNRLESQTKVRIRHIRKEGHDVTLLEPADFRLLKAKRAASLSA